MKAPGRIWVELASLTAVAALLASPFNLPWTWKLLLIPPIAMMLGSGWRHLKNARQSQAADLGYTVWLSDLATRLGNGETFERAIALSGAGLARQQGVSAIFTGQVQGLSDALAAGIGLERGLQELLRQSPCPSVEPLVLAFPLLRQKGCRLDLFLKEGNHLRRELAALEAETAAEQSQSRAEALILAILPFFLPLALGSLGKYQSAPQHSQFGWMVESLCLLVAVGALVWVLLIRQLDSSDSIRSDAARKSHTLPKNKLDSLLTSLCDSRFLHRAGRLADRTYQTVSSLQVSAGPSLVLVQDDSRRDYFSRKVLLMLTAGLLGLIWHWHAGWSPLAIPALSGAAAILQDWNQLQLKRRQINQYRLDYPVFCHWLTALLQNGIPVGQALMAGHRIWHPAFLASAVANDLDQIDRAIQGGRPLRVMIEMVADQCPVLELQAFWHAIGRYDREGGQPLLQMLHLQNQANFQLLRNGRRQRLGEQQLILLLPMMLDLLVILTLAAWPAISQLMTA